MVGEVVTEPLTASLKVSEFVNPAGPGSLQPNLTRTPNGRLVLSWLEPRPEMQVEVILCGSRSSTGKAGRGLMTLFGRDHSRTVLRYLQP